MLVNHLFRGQVRKAGKQCRGWTNHIGCLLFQYISEWVLLSLRSKYEGLDEPTRQNIRGNGVFDPFSIEELQHMIALHYSAFVSGGNEDDVSEENHMDDAIVYLAHLRASLGKLAQL